MKLKKPICKPNQIVVAYSSKPFKDNNKIGFMVPVNVNKEDGAVIYIHSKLSTYNKSVIAIHEALHLAYPDLTENQVIYGAKIIAKVLNLAGFKKK